MVEHTKNRYPGPKSKKKPQRDGRRGTIMIKSLDEWPTNWRTIILNKFFHCCEDSEPLIRLPSLGIQQRKWEYPQDWVKQKLLSWNAHTKSSAHQNPEGRSSDSQRKLNQNCLLVLEGLLWQHGSAGAHHRDGGTGSSILEWSLFV